MTVCIVPGYALLEPDDLADAQVFTEIALNLLPSQIWIPIFMEQALLCGQEGSAAVDIDGAALQDYPRPEKPDIQVLVDQIGYGHICHQLRILLTPGIEDPGYRCHPALSGSAIPVDHKYGAIIPEPYIGIADNMKVNPSQIDLLPFESVYHLILHYLVSDQQIDDLALMDGPDHCGIGIFHRLYLREAVQIVGPGQPDGLMLLPLPRHMIA